MSEQYVQVTIKAPSNTDPLSTDIQLMVMDAMEKIAKREFTGVSAVADIKFIVEKPINPIQSHFTYRGMLI